MLATLTHSDAQDCGLLLDFFAHHLISPVLGPHTPTHRLSSKDRDGLHSPEAGLPGLSLEPLVDVPWNARLQLLLSHTATAAKTDTKIGVPSLSDCCFWTRGSRGHLQSRANSQEACQGPPN